MKTLVRATLVALALPGLLGGCAAGLGSGDYSRVQARQAMDVEMGRVESVRQVRIEGTKTPIGAGAGAVMGGVAGSTVGKGTGSILAAGAGAVLGGLAGAAVEEGVTRKPGLEITVTLDNGRTLAVTQEDDGEQFLVGDRVRVLTGGDATRVSH